MSDTEKVADRIPSQILDLMLDVVLEVMRGESGSIMLLDESSGELKVRSARGLKDRIMKEARVRLGSGISGKVAASGQSVFISGVSSDRRLNICPEDMINPGIAASYVAPIRLNENVLGTININSSKENHKILAEKEELVRGILSRFMEYLIQSGAVSSQETPSQIYLMNIFREYNTLRELRVVFDYMFDLITCFLNIKQKGIFFLKDPESVYFDLVLGYGFQTPRYQEIYDKLIPQMKRPEIESVKQMTIFDKKMFSLPDDSLFLENHLILIPMIADGVVRGQMLIFSDEVPSPNSTIQTIIRLSCDAAAKVIGSSISGQFLQELTLTDSLTGTYNYGLWWKRLHEEFSRAKRQKNTNISLLVLNVDHFKRFNLSHGYFLGDQLLRLIADRIKLSVRLVDIVGRIGGQEFGVILLGADKKSSFEISDRIFKSIAAIPEEMRIKLEYPITLSGGIAVFPEDTDSPSKLVEMAKTALVSAKILGGDRVKSFESVEE